MDGEIRGRVQAFLLLFDSISLSSSMPGICNHWREGRDGGRGSEEERERYMMERGVFHRERER